MSRYSDLIDLFKKYPYLIGLCAKKKKIKKLQNKNIDMKLQEKKKFFSQGIKYHLSCWQVVKIDQLIKQTNKWQP